VNPESVQRMIDWAARKRFLRVPIQVDQLVDRRFLDAAGE
jgi:hypothetical protein